MQPAAAQSFILDVLRRELNDSLSYHSVRHTEEVIRHSALLAEKMGVTGKQLDLLTTAAAYHDSGFLETYSGHEEVSCRLAGRYLPQFGYTEEEIASVCALIMATRLPQSPDSELAAILSDADLYYLGTTDYDEVSSRLFEEYRRRGLVKNEADWEEQQIEFLSAHRYFTTAAQGLLETKKQETLAMIVKKRSAPKPAANIKPALRDALLIVAGVVITAFALKGFLVPNHFFDGGVTGISLLLHELYHWNLGYVIIAANIPLIAASFFTINRGFAIKTFISVVLLGVCLLYPGFPVITSDKLLISIFGGFFLGVGIGLTMRAGCAVDGIEVLALYTLRRSSFTISEIILGLNIIIFGLAAFKFGIQTSLYSMLTYFTASKTIDYVVEGLEAYTGVTIISAKSEEIKHRLVNGLGRGITVYKGERGYLPGKFEVHDDCDIIFTIITRLEMRRLKNMVTEIDPRAFVFANTIKETSGGIIKRRRSH